MNPDAARATGDSGARAFRLYGSPLSDNSYKAALMLALCGQAFDFAAIDLEAGETRTEAYRQVNRFQEIPALEHGSHRIVQSGVILTYLAEQFGRFTHAGGTDRWRIQEWLAWDNHRMTTGPALLQHHLRHLPGTDPSVFAFLRARSERAINVLASSLEDREWLVGGAPTIADISIAGTALGLGEDILDSRRSPAVEAWLDRIRSLPGFAPAAVLMRAG